MMPTAAARSAAHLHLPVADAVSGGASMVLVDHLDISRDNSDGQWQLGNRVTAVIAESYQRQQSDSIGKRVRVTTM